MKTTGIPGTHPNHIDYALGTNFDTAFVLENVVDGVIAFANGDVRPNPERHLYAVATADDGTELFFGNHPGTRNATLVPRKEALAQFSRHVEDDRSRAIEVLDIAAKGLTSLSAFLRTIGDIEEAVDLAMNLTMTFDKSGRAVMGWRISGPSMCRGWAMVAALLVTESAHGDLTEVGRCQLDSCQRFFRIKRDGPGKPSRKYCPYFGDDPLESHMEKAHALASTARSQKKRRRDAAVERTKKGRRAPAGKK